MNRYQKNVNKLYNTKVAKYSPEELENETLMNKICGEAVKKALAIEAKRPVAAFCLLIGFTLIFTALIIKVQAQTQKTPQIAAQATTAQEIVLEKLPPKETGVTYLGKFKCAAYCPCAECCGSYAYNRPIDEFGNVIIYGASGQRLIPNKSVAVDPAIIPYGSILLINGNEYIAADTGGFNGYVIDFFCEYHSEAMQIGGGYIDVYLEG